MSCVVLRTMAGAAQTSVRNSPVRLLALLATGLLLFATGAAAQTLYKYRGPDGEWIYTDRQPDKQQSVETRKLAAGSRSSDKFEVSYAINGQTFEVTASNPFHVPVEVALSIERIEGIGAPAGDDLRWVVAPLAEERLLELDILQTSSAPVIQYRFTYLAGDPESRHAPQMPYRVPYAVGLDHVVSQAYPDVTTHRTPDSYHAVDIAMPTGTDIVAARGGIVFDVASNNFEGGTDPEAYGNKANVVRILHDDGTYAIYAHLNWNSIRVRPGDVVERGQYIADSGNTGFSSGPHLHFAVVRNAGMTIESLPVTFTGSNAAAVTPSRGMTLTAY